MAEETTLGLKLLVVICVLFVIYILRNIFQKTPNYTLPPGPSYLECWQIFKRCLTKFEIHLIGEELTKRYGEIFKITFFGKHLVFLNSVRLNKMLLSSSKYKEFTNDRPPSFVKKNLEGSDIVFSDNTKTQAKLRKLVHGIIRLYGDGIKDFEGMMNSEVQRLETNLYKACGDESFDMDRALNYSLIRVIHLFLTQESPENIDALVKTVEKFDIYAQLLFRNDNNTALMMFPFLQHMPDFIPGSRKSIVDNYNSLRRQLYDFYLNPTSRQKLIGNPGLIGQLLLEQEKDPESINDKNIQGTLVNMLVAAFVTTKGALSGFFLLMIKYPNVQHRIQNEIDKHIGKRRPFLSDRENLHYTNATILEVLRFIRHTPINIPHSTSQDIEVEGCVIPAHSTLFTNTWSILRNKEYFEDPEEFKPERFLDTDGNILQIDHPKRQAVSVIFGNGRRSCLGESFAKSRIFLYVTSLLQKFNFSAGDNPIPSENSTDWEPTAALHPPYLNCVVQKR